MQFMKHLTNRFLLSCCLIVGISLGLVQKVCADESYRDIEYSKVNEYLSVFQRAKSPYIYSKNSLTVKEEGLNLSDVTLTLIDNNTETKTETPITIAEDGTVELPAVTDQQAEKMALRINQPKGAVSFSINFGIETPKTKQVDYRTLFLILEDTNNFIDEMGGMASMFAPTMEELKFTFEQPASIEIRSKNKLQTFNTDDEFVIMIEQDDDLLEENPQVVFSHLAKSMSPED